jgi:hypothetical protein
MSSSTIKLNFINKSQDVNNSSVVIFQKNVKPSFNESAIAWQVIKNCGIDDIHPFTYSQSMTVSASDSFGNFTPQLTANPGDAFDVTLTTSGDQIAKSLTPANDFTEVDVRNLLTTGSITANIYKDGNLLAIKKNIVPQEMAAFVFKPAIYIGIVSNIEEGDVMDSDIVNSINQQISLLGVASADIVMSGGGAGATATALQFSLQNVVMA